MPTDPELWVAFLLGWGVGRRDDSWAFAVKVTQAMRSVASRETINEVTDILRHGNCPDSIKKEVDW